MQGVEERTSPALLRRAMLRRTHPLVRPRAAHRPARKGGHREAVAPVDHATGDMPVVTRSDQAGSRQFRASVARIGAAQPRGSSPDARSRLGRQPRWDAGAQRCPLTRPLGSNISATRDLRSALEPESRSAATSRRAMWFVWNCWLEPGTSSTGANIRRLPARPTLVPLQPGDFGQAAAPLSGRDRSRSHRLSHRSPWHPGRPAGSALRLRCACSTHAVARRYGMTGEGCHPYPPRCYGPPKPVPQETSLSDGWRPGSREARGCDARAPRHHAILYSILGQPTAVPPSVARSRAAPRHTTHSNARNPLL